MQNDMREILIDLIKQGARGHTLMPTECIADYLIANDVVPVVRCKDCKHYKAQEKSAHWENKTKYCCRVATLKVNDNDFCSYGERKEDNG